ncbi:MATE family efflux transporter [Pseudoalteromonas flavipulchra]|nr:MATE family efflux transporter [Pseudoalteromonas flavipulchra]KID33358.1 multidrug transporter MatE [Pseudoalteromonas flavipulchra NCIMB 2033 = ATCC BAA-314]MBD0781892.1 MATE family efflux transporter [Pseudoalteromonas flavipulchra]MBE0373075.1 hypothetical protein [Pseudoalteromonas flavipulchra NCIMB 2033 = ATCC BAA-314]
MILDDSVKDLTQGSIPKHIISMALPLAIGMLVHTLYMFTDLYFVSQLGDAETTALSLVGNVLFFIFAISQILNVGTATLIANSVGKKNQAESNSIFNQAILLSCILGLVVLSFGLFVIQFYLQHTTTDLAVREAAMIYTKWFIPCLAMQFLFITLGAAMRGIGIVKPMMFAQLGSLLLNILLSPLLITGWGFIPSMGISGAGLASSISMILAIVVTLLYFRKADGYLRIDLKAWKIDRSTIKKLLVIGGPVGLELTLTFCYISLTFWAIKDLTMDVQAALSIGSKIIQGLSLPMMAVVFSLPAVAGQNFGANNLARFKYAFFWVMCCVSIIMLLMSVIAINCGSLLATPFSNDANVIDQTQYFLEIVAFNFIATGIVYSCSGIFQATGNTFPSLISNASRLFTFVLPVIWLVLTQRVSVELLWHLSVITVLIQAALSLYLARNHLGLIASKISATDYSVKEVS